VAAELREAFPGVDLTLVPSSGGVFDVVVDGTPVFSKQQFRRHAEPGEVVERIRAAGMGR
jgi:selT/selW/selH-like putative selenoprotein